MHAICSKHHWIADAHRHRILRNKSQWNQYIKTWKSLLFYSFPPSASIYFNRSADQLMSARFFFVHKDIYIVYLYIDIYCLVFRFLISTLNFPVFGTNWEKLNLNAWNWIESDMPCIFFPCFFLPQSSSSFAFSFEMISFFPLFSDFYLFSTFLCALKMIFEEGGREKKKKRKRNTDSSSLANKMA